MNFEIVQHIDAAIDEIEKVMFDPEFIVATSDLPRLDDCVLLSSREADGVFRAQIHRRFGAELNSAVRRVIDPKRLTWVEHVEYNRTTKRSQHVIHPDHYADRLRANYDTQLESVGTMTSRTTHGTLSVKAAFVAKRIEAAIVDGLEVYATAEAELIGEWAAR